MDEYVIPKSDVLCRTEESALFSGTARKSSRSCRLATPRCMKMQARVVYDRLRLCRAKAGNLWCGKPAKQSGPDIAPNPTLSPPSADGEHAEQIVFAFDVLRRGKKGDDHGEHLSLLRWFGCA